MSEQLLNNPQFLAILPGYASAIVSFIAGIAVANFLPEPSRPDLLKPIPPLCLILIMLLVHLTSMLWGS